VKKVNIHTTISLSHWEILKKHEEHCETQQKVLELALENLGDESSRPHPISLEEKQWMRIGKELKNNVSLIQKNSAKILFETASVEKFREYIGKEKLLEFAIEWFYKKPVKQCNLLSRHGPKFQVSGLLTAGVLLFNLRQHQLRI
jgi:hypothetical protein